MGKYTQILSGFYTSFLLILFSSYGHTDMSPNLNSDEFKNQAAYMEAGNHSYSSFTGKLKSSFGCTIKYTHYEVESPVADTLVVLGHGFFRSQKTQYQLAQHFAAWGFNVVTLDFCNSRPWNGHHDRNGKDMISLAQHLGAQKIIYAGFSAGGLAAYLAAAEDNNAIGYLGLDMVDNFKKGLKAAPEFSVPGFALLAEPSMCNAKGNGLEVFQNTQLKPEIIKLSGASHCDFEFPYDGKCSLACGKSEKPYQREDIQKIILGLSTSALFTLSGTTHASTNWWDKTNNVFNYLSTQSFISSPKLD